MNQEEISRLASVAAKRYARSCWWADLDDLTQVGELAGVLAARSFDTKVGATPQQYLWRAITFAIARACWRDSAPVSGGGHRPRESLTGLRRADVATLDADGAAELHAHVPTPEKSYAEAEWRARVREQILALVDGDSAILDVVLDGELPAKAAQRRGLDVRKVAAAVRNFRGRAEMDATLYELLLEQRKR